MPKALASFLFVLCLSVPVLAQDRALITGDVEDQNDTPLQGVKVTLRNDSLRIERTATTNSSGFYFFADVSPADDYAITAESSGVEFAPKTVKFNVRVGENRHLLPSFVVATPATSFLRTQPGPATPGFARLQVGSRHELPGGGEGQQAPPQTNVASAKGAKQKKRPDTTEVQSSPVPLDTVTNAVSTVITPDQLRTLPLYNRNFLALGLLVANTHDVPGGSELKDTTFSVSGQRPTSNAFLLDGMDNVASSSNQAIPFQVNDAIQEFRVTTAGADAQFGRNMGGVVNVVTQRGTAQFHGSLFGFFGADALNSANPISVFRGSGFSQAAAFAGAPDVPAVADSNQGGSPPVYEPTSYNQYVNTVIANNAKYGTTYCTVPNAQYGSAGCNPHFDPAAILAEHNNFTQPFSSQQFGGRAGGSFLKRWFWFGDYEGTRINNPAPIFERVPSSYDRGHLSQFDSNLNPGGYQDAKFAQNVLALYPQSNVVAVPDVLEFYQGQAPNYTNVNNYLARLDFNQTSNTDWSFRYNLQKLGQLHDDTLPSSSTYPGNGAIRDAQNQNAVVTFTHRFATGTSNVIRGGFTQFRVNETPQDRNFNAAQAGLPPGWMSTYLLSGLDPQYAGAQRSVIGAFAGWNDAIWNNVQPTIAPSLDGLFPFARIGAPLSAPAERRDSEWQLLDNVSMFRGRHSLRFGGEVRGLLNYFSNTGVNRGFMVSSDIGEFTTDSATCNTSVCGSLAFTNPGFDYGVRPQAPYQSNFHSYVVAGYAQDSWRLKSNLVINLGLRYEYFSPAKETNNQVWNYDPLANGLVRQGSTAVLNPFGVNCNDAQGGQPLGLSSVYWQPGTFWNCGTSGNGNFVQTSTTNFEPRIGVVWSTPSGDTVLRAGFGMFYDQLPVSDIAQLMFNRPVLYSNSNPAPQAIYGQNYGDFGQCPGVSCSLGNSSWFGVPPSQLPFQAASLPFAVNAIDPQHHNDPMTRQVTASVERQLTRLASLELGYVGNFIANLPVKTNTGFNNEWFCTASANVNPDQPCDFFSYTPVFTLANRGYGNYNALYFKVVTSNWHGLQARASYTYSKALDNGSSTSPTLIPAPMMTNLGTVQYYGLGSPTFFGIGSWATSPTQGIFQPGAISANVASLTGLLTQGLSTTGVGEVHVTPYTVPQSPYNFLRNDYGRSDYDQTNRFLFEYTWEIPHPKPSAFLSGWNLSGILVAQSGQPFTIFSSVAGELTQRVNLTSPLTTTGSPDQYIGNAASIALPSASCANAASSYSPYVFTNSAVGIRSGVAGTPCLGNSARNQFTGPAYVDFDMGIQKSFKVGERMALLFRVESFNLFNRANYYNPISTYSLDGVNPYSQFGQIQSAHNPREFQFAVRMNW